MDYLSFGMRSIAERAWTLAQQANEFLENAGDCFDEIHGYGPDQDVAMTSEDCLVPQNAISQPKTTEEQPGLLQRLYNQACAVSQAMDEFTEEMHGNGSLPLEEELSQAGRSLLRLEPSEVAPLSSSEPTLLAQGRSEVAKKAGGIGDFIAKHWTSLFALAAVSFALYKMSPVSLTAGLAAGGLLAAYSPRFHSIISGSGKKVAEAVGDKNLAVKMIAAGLVAGGVWFLSQSSYLLPMSTCISLVGGVCIASFAWSLQKRRLDEMREARTDDTIKEQRSREEKVAERASVIEQIRKVGWTRIAIFLGVAAIAAVYSPTLFGITVVTSALLSSQSSQFSKAIDKTTSLANKILGSDNYIAQAGIAAVALLGSYLLTKYLPFGGLTTGSLLAFGGVGSVSVVLGHRFWKMQESTYLSSQEQAEASERKKQDQGWLGWTASWVTSPTTYVTQQLFDYATSSLFQP